MWPIRLLLDANLRREGRRVKRMTMIKKNMFSRNHTYWNDGWYTIDNYPAERSVRPFTCDRKVSLFYGSHEEEDISVVYQTFVESCKLACISVKDYLVKFFKSTAAGRTDYQNLLPTTIGLRQ